VIVSRSRTRPEDGFGPIFRMNNFRGPADRAWAEFDLVGLAGIIEGFSCVALGVELRCRIGRVSKKKH
jgi:hypothetical protein